jgi:hypothetical protein
VDNWDTRSAKREYADVAEFCAWVDEVERIKAAAEGAFRAALRAGRVLVEHWLIGTGPSVATWTGAECGGDRDAVAAHVANRFRAGWTRVEVK